MLTHAKVPATASTTPDPIRFSTAKSKPVGYSSALQNMEVAFQLLGSGVENPFEIQEKAHPFRDGLSVELMPAIT
jgi:hypothetical protein